jgi:signal recognition particle GTPase
VVAERGYKPFQTWKMSGCIRQRLGPTKKRLKDRIEQAETFLQEDVSLDETEDKANQLLLKLERNLETYKDLLQQLQEASKEDEAKVSDWKMKWKTSVFSRLMETKLFAILKRF